MSLRTTLASLLLTLTALAGCASSTPTAELTAAESARLVELNERLTASNASPDSTLSADERREILVEVQRLQNKQEAASESEKQSEKRGDTIVLVGLAVVGVALLISSIDFDFDFDFGGGDN